MDLDDIFTPTDAELEFEQLIEDGLSYRNDANNGEPCNHVAAFYANVLDKQASTIPF